MEGCGGNNLTHEVETDGVDSNDESKKRRLTHDALTTKQMFKAEESTLLW